MKPRMFIVTTDPYTRGGNAPFKQELYYARDLDELATLLGWRIDPETWDDSDPIPSPWENLKSGHGDGADGYIISELKGPDVDRLALVEILP